MKLTTAVRLANAFVLFSLQLFLAQSVLAQAYQVDWNEHLKPQLGLAAHDHSLFGDAIDLQTGRLSFEQIDVSIPGNFDLPVEIRRRRNPSQSYNNEFADWQLAAPTISTKIMSTEIAHGSRWGKARCSRELEFAIPDSRVAYWEFDKVPGNQLPRQYSNGVILDVPGRISTQVLDKTDTGSWPDNAQKVTAAGWFLTCIPNIDGEGTEGFYAYAPNGDRYRFDVMRWKKAVATLYRWDFETSRFGYWTSFFAREDVWYDVLAASEVIDVNGNQVFYDYDNQGRLTSIRASDGRRINLIHYSSSSKIVVSVIASPGSPDERSWAYSYGSSQPVNHFVEPARANGNPTYKDSNYYVLKAVALPNGRNWQFNLGGLFANEVPGNSYTSITSDSVVCKQPDQIVSITHPDGMVGEFVLAERSVYMPMAAIGNPSRTPCPNSNFLSEAKSSSYVDLMSVVKKTLSGPGAPTATWKYQYETGDLDRTTIIQPDGSKIYNRYPSIFNTNPSAIIDSAVYASESDTTPIQITEFTYLLESEAGNNFVIASKPEDSRPLRRKEVTLTRGSDWYKTRYTYISDRYASNYSYGYPTKIEKWSSLSSGTRITDTTYLKDADDWILGLTDTVTKNGKLFDDFGYDAKGRVTSHKRFGVTVGTYGYYTSGTQAGKVSWYKDALNRQTSFSGYYRGIPGTVTRADNTTLGRTVDENGWVTSITDWRGYTTGYEYNSVGRLTQIDRPSPWSTTNITYTYSNGKLIQQAARGTELTTTTYDAMLRQVQVRRQALSGGGGNIYTETEYDPMGRAVFTSLPSTSAGSSIGIETDYDALGRVTQARETAAGGGATSYEYLGSNKTRVIDALGHATTTTYSAFGDPDDGDAVKIEKPEGITVDQTYDVYGNLLTIAQLKNDGTTHDSAFSYDSSLRLCRRHIPETGDTLYSYNGANEMIAYAEGQPAGTGCATPLAAAAVNLTYYLNGLLRITDYPGSTPDINRSYDANGNLTGLTRGDTGWAYSYNNIDLLDMEELSIDNRTYTIHYGYDDDGNLIGKGFPSGRLYQFNNDGFGRPVSVASDEDTYLSSINYFANGTIDYLYRGNGGFYEQNLNARQLVSYIGGNWGESLNYSYDALGRVVQVNSSNASYNRLLDYDGAGRLTSASGPWGVGSYSYDKLNNITRKTLGGRSVDIEYNSLNRIGRVNDSGEGSSWRNYSHDARGNVIADGRHTFTYDFANQPVSISGGDNGDFVYDGNLRRVKEQVGGKTIYSIYDRSGTLLTREEIKFILIYQGNGIDIPIPISSVTDYLHIGGKTFVRVNNGEASYPLNDHLGSAIMVADENGAISAANTFNYTPFGETIGNDPGDGNQQGFTGHIEDATGLTYMQARYYDPVIGRFLQTDPIGYEDQMNLYAYVANDPMNNTDPNGKICVPCAGAVVGAVMDIAAQGAVIALTDATISDFSVSSVVISAAAGATGAGLASNIAKLGMTVKGAATGMNVVADTAVSSVSTLAKGEELTATGVAIDVIAGRTAGAAVGNAASKAASGSTSQKVAVNAADRAARIGNKSNARRAQRNRVHSTSSAAREIPSEAEAVGGVIGSNAASNTARAACQVNGASC